MALKTQGTNLYAIDPADDSVIVVGCVTTITGISAARDQIETTCLEAQARSYEAGMLTPGAANFGINVDPSDPSHVRLHELYVSGDTLKWTVGLADGTAAPTVTAGEFVLPTTRSWISFEGYISDFPFDFALSAVVASTVALQVSGFPVLTPKA